MDSEEKWIDQSGFPEISTLQEFLYEALSSLIPSLKIS